MEKETLKSHLVVLTRIYDEFVGFQFDKRAARNAKQKALVERRISSCLLGFKGYVERHSELFKLMTEEGGITDFGRTLIWDEISSDRYFENEIKDFLERMKDHINKQN